jgi:hypothetical protein
MFVLLIHVLFETLSKILAPFRIYVRKCPQWCTKLPCADLVTLNIIH